MTQSNVRGEETRQGAGRSAQGAGGGTPGALHGGLRGGRSRRRAGRRHRVLRWSASTLAVLILVTAGAGYLYYRHLDGNIEKGERTAGDSKAARTEPNAAGQTPLNILLIGSDSRASDANVKLGGGKDKRGNAPLADVQMLIHLAADRKSAAMVSIPRDTRVDIPACKDPDSGKTYPATNDIINVTLARGGAGCTMAAWENLTGVYIDHWMTIDFAGVVRMADAVGGVEVCVKQNVWDHSTPAVPGGSGLKIPEGTHKVQGERALQWLRTRHAWGSDPMRARAQHMYMNSMIRTLQKQNAFTDAPRLMDLAEAATKSLIVSEEIGTVKKLYDLGKQLKTVPPDRITMATLPTVADPQDHNHLVPAGAEGEKMWAMLRDDVSFDKKGGSGKKPAAGTGTPAAGSSRAPEDPPAADGDIDVLVRNGTRSATLGPVSGRAGTVAGALNAKGFGKAAKATSPATFQETTVVRYPSDDLAGDARRVADALGIPAASLQLSVDVSGVTLVVGADWRSGTSFPKQKTPEAGDLPKTSNALNGSETDTCMDVYKPYQW